MESFELEAAQVTINSRNTDARYFICTAFDMVFKETQVLEVSIPLPKSLDTRIYIRVATLDKAVMVSLTTASQDEMGATTPMGSMVYALPDVSYQKPMNQNFC